MSNKKKWFKKQQLDINSIKTLGIDPSLLDIASPIVHEDDIEGVSDFLGMAKKFVLSVLYKECDAPEGIIKVAVN